MQWAYLRTGLKAISPPMEIEVAEAQRLADSVPISYVILDRLQDSRMFMKYAIPMVRDNPERWELVYSAAGNGTTVYRRIR
jgi:hypothetical protein